jgi:hypothetical protein
MMDVFPENPGLLRRRFLSVGIGFIACGSLASIAVRQRVVPAFAELPPVTVAGRVFTRLPGVSVKGLEVLARQTVKGPRASALLSWKTRTNFAGTYYFTAATPGPVDILMNRPPGVPWTAKIFRDVKTPRLEPVWIELTSGVTMKGRVLWNGAPLPDIMVGLKNADPEQSAHFGGDRFETRTDADGRFAFQHVAVGESFWVYAETGSLPSAAALTPRRVATGEDRTTLDLGEMEVRPGLSLAGRVALSDGKSVPEGTTLTAWPMYAWGGLTATVDRAGRFIVRGLPPGPVSLSVHFPAPSPGVHGRGRRRARYRLSPRNRYLDADAGWQLACRIDHDVTDLTILCDPAEPEPMVWNRAEKLPERQW